jgi:hypothetical protein
VIDNLDLKALVSPTKNHALAQSRLNPRKMLAPFPNIDLVRFIEVRSRERHNQLTSICLIDKESKDLPLRRKIRGRFLALCQFNPFVLIEVQDFHETTFSSFGARAALG